MCIGVVVVVVVVKLYYYMVSMSMVCAHGAAVVLRPICICINLVRSALYCVRRGVVHTCYIHNEVKYSTKYGAMCQERRNTITVIKRKA